MKKITVLFAALSFALTAPAQVSWLTKGNAGLTTNHTIGTTDAVTLIFKTNASQRAEISATGQFSFTTDSFLVTKSQNAVSYGQISNATNSVLSSAQFRIKGSAATLSISSTSANFTPLSTHYGANMTILQSNSAVQTSFINTADVPFFFCTNGSGTTNAALKITTTASYVRRAGGSEEQIISAAAVNTVSPTSPNRTIEVVIGGVTYYIAAKTTNN